MRHHNNFDFLRMAAATAVLASHQFALSGFAEPEWTGGSYGGLGVLIFFALSGYLVAGSWRRDPRALSFLTKRFLRIWPGLAVAVALTVFGLGLLATTLDARAYLSSPGVWRYLRVLDLQHFEAGLPGVFATGLAHTSVNGSLWTIPLEVRCYLLLVLLGMAGLLRRRVWFLAAFAAACIWFFLYTRVQDVPVDRMRVQLVVVFFAGVLLQAFQDRWLRYRYPLLAFALAAAWWVWYSVWREFAFTMVLPLTVVVLGMGSAPVLRRFGRFGDFSYGMYIYAFPVQQAVLWATGSRLSVPLGFCVSFALCLGCAALSWHLVEKRALRLKPRAQRPGAPSEGPSTHPAGATAVPAEAQLAASR